MENFTSVDVAIARNGPVKNPLATSGLSDQQISGGSTNDAGELINQLSANSSSNLLSEETRSKFLSWILHAVSNRRIARKLQGDGSSIILEHAWVFQFIDIIYVATMFKISHLIGVCGKGTDVYVIACAYFAIMFSTRQAFDVYTCISGANGILHVIAFCIYGFGVFIMTVNIASHRSTQYSDDIVHPDVANPDQTDISYGSCKRTLNYDISFATAFIFTRVVLVVMYSLYFFVFHESNILGELPDLHGELQGGSHDVRLSDITTNRESDMSQLRELSMAAANSQPINFERSMTNTGDLAGGSQKKVGFDTSEASPGSSRESPTPLQAPRTSFVLRVTHAYRASTIKRHFSRIFLLKVVPVMLSSMVVFLIIFGYSPLIILPIAASIEFVGDFLPDVFVKDDDEWKEMNASREFAEERLGLLFMLVLGEAVLGFSSINYDADEQIMKIYRTLIFSFFTIFTLGMQQFEPLQEYTKAMGPHPLSIKGLCPVYIWLLALTSFFLLVAANGMVELYYKVANHEELTSDEVQDQEEKVSNGLGSVIILMLVLKIMDKVYYRERLLPNPIFGWLNRLYVSKNEQSQTSTVQFDNMSVSALEASNIHGAGYGNNHPTTAAATTTRDSVSTVSSDVSARSGSGSVSNHRNTIKIVPKSAVSVGIRKIRPLTALKLVTAACVYSLWKFNIPAAHFMMLIFALVAFPNLVEVILEVRQFFIRQSEMRSISRKKSIELGAAGL